MTFTEEMEAFQKHLALVLTNIEGGDDIETLTNNIAIEYADWKEEQTADEREASEYEQMLSDDLHELEQSQRVA